MAAIWDEGFGPFVQAIASINLTQLNTNICTLQNIHAHTKLKYILCSTTSMQHSYKVLLIVQGNCLAVHSDFAPHAVVAMLAATTDLNYLASSSAQPAASESADANRPHDLPTEANPVSAPTLNMAGPGLYSDPAQALPLSQSQFRNSVLGLHLSYASAPRRLARHRRAAK